VSFVSFLCAFCCVYANERVAKAGETARKNIDDFTPSDPVDTKA
jgi:hypothetical protein